MLRLLVMMIVAGTLVPTAEAKAKRTALSNQFIDGCSATPAGQGMDGAQVNHDPGSLQRCADRDRRAHLT
jgi:hypothetical protein